MGALKKKAGYFAYWLIPLVDLDILGVLGLDSLPLVEKIGISELTGGQKVLLAALILIPYFDLELLKLLGLNPLESSDQPTLDPAYHDKTAQRPEDGRGGGQGDFRGGVKQGFQDTVNINVSKEDAGTSVGKVLGGLVVLLVVFFMLLFLVRGTVIGEYLGYGQETVGDRFVADLPTRAEGPIRVYMQARDRVFCLLEGPACLREHRLNRTTRPGSDEVGQNYGLKIDRFEVGQGDQLDVAHKNADYQIPISFTLSNPRHGLKGINARNVEYRLMMIDNDRDRSDPYCDTGWIGIQDAYDADGDDSYDDIFPGTSASTGFLTITSDGADNSIVAPGDGITLQDCEMLQPALGQHRTMLLNVKYDYFSQATLNFEAMSQENFQSNPEIQKVWKGSQTADTPVKAAINVNSPVLFREGTGEPRSFGIRATLNTDKSDVEYQVKDLLVRNSEYVQSSDGTCQLENVNGEHDFSPGEHLVPRDGVDGARTGVPDTENSELYGVSGSDSGSPDSNSPRASLIAGADPNRDSEYHWFDMNRQPPIMGCRMQLSDTSSISPSGETLTMGVAANYTVSKRYSLGSFEAVNTRCSRPNLNCPMIVTLNDDSGVSDYNFRNECTGVDAGNGCSIVEPDLENWGTAGTHEGEPVPLNKRVQNPDGSWDTSRSSDDTVERRELAVAIEDTTGDNTGEIYYAGLDTVTLRSIDRDIFRGDQESEDLSGTDPFAIVHYRSYDGEYETEIDNNVPGNYCEEGGMKEYKERQAEQEMNVLKWHCPGQEDSSGGSWLEDVLTAMTPFYKGS